MRCETVKADGERCRAQALPGKRACTFHDASNAQRCNEGRRQGGRARMQPASVVTVGTDAPDLSFSNAAEIVRSLTTAINEVRRGRLDVKILNATAVAAGVILRCVEGVEVEQRLKELRELLAEVRK